jgi:hypothetical protein
MIKRPEVPRNREAISEGWEMKGGVDMEKLVSVVKAPTKKSLLGTGMRSILSKKAGFWAVVMLSILSISTGVLAQDTPFAKDGVYVGFDISYNTISGDFDGESLLASATEIIIIPKIEGSVGIGALLGVRFAKGALELSYQRSKHDATWLGASGTVAYNIVDIDFKLYPSIDSQLQPYFLVGMAIPWLVIHDGAATVTEIDDATLLGIGLNIGGGVAYYIQPTICVNGGLTYRWISYSSATGVSSVSNDIQGGLDGSGLTLNFGITFSF